MKTRRIKVRTLSRVEGEGAIEIEIEDGVVRMARLNIFEPPRLFEAFLRGRSSSELPDLVARICGICPTAHQITAVQAIERAFGVEPQGSIRTLRRLLACGEWIESHALHVFLLHAPDFLGYPDAFHMAKDHPEMARRGLELKKLGNQIMTLLGGRAVHPVTLKIGGFYRVPDKSALAGIGERLKWACDAAREAVRWTAGLPFPDFERRYLFVSLRHDLEYPMNDGDLIGSDGMKITAGQYEEHFREEQVSHSNALHSHSVEGQNCFVGPLARFNLNFDKLSPSTREVARSVGFSPPAHNPFKSIVARAVELLDSCIEALRLIETYEPPTEAAVGFEPRSAQGCCLTEAPRGTLYHAYQTDEKGLVLRAKIVPPTAQNQGVMEEDLRDLARQYACLPKPELTWRCEQAIRNYDPCISCATHFVNLQKNRKDGTPI